MRHRQIGKRAYKKIPKNHIVHQVVKRFRSGGKVHMAAMIAFFCIVLLSFFPACEKGQRESHSPPRRSIACNIATEPRELDPRRAETIEEVNIISAFMEGLMRCDINDQPALALAESISASNEGRVQTITLKKSSWSNGDPVTAYDFVRSWKTSLSPDFHAPHAEMLYAMKNAREIKMGTLPSSLLGVKTPDARTLVVELDRPTPQFQALLTHPIFFPIHAKTDEIALHQGWETFIGNGPFFPKEREPQRAIKATKNRRYWDEKHVSLDRLDMIVASGEEAFELFASDVLNWYSDRLAHTPPDAVSSRLQREKMVGVLPMFATQWVWIDTEKSPFDSKKLRQALSLAIDREEIIEEISPKDRIATMRMIPTAEGMSEGTTRRELCAERARQLFEEALRDKGVTQRDFPKVALAHRAEERIARLLQSQWHRTLGIEVVLTDHRSDDLAQSSPLVLENWVADFADPMSFFKSLPPTFEGSSLGDVEAYHRQLLEQFHSCRSAKERLAILRQSDTALIEERVAIPIAHHTTSYAKNRNVQNVLFTPTGRVDFRWASVK